MTSPTPEPDAPAQDPEAEEEFPEVEEAPGRQPHLRVLADLGVHGWEAYEPVLLAAVMLGEPFLLISEPGSGKTYFGSVLAAALDLRYGYYDTAKANFEDILGFPNPAAFREGRAEFVHNEITIWDKEVVMVDEVSRAARDTSNKWLEILGSRKLMGRLLPIRVIMGGMNPPEHQGTHPLDEAFADRFAFFVRLPEFTGMTEETRAAILGGHTGLDAPSVDYWASSGADTQVHDYVLSSPAFQAASVRLRGLLQIGAEHYRRLEGDGHAEQVARYADQFAAALARDAGCKLEPRRLKMMKRAILAVMAMRCAMSELGADEQLTEAERIECARLVAGLSMPHPYTAQGALTEPQLMAAHEVAASALKGDPSEYILYSAASWAEKMRLMLSGRYSQAVMNKICADFHGDPSLEADMTAIVVAQLLMTEAMATALPAHLMDKLAKRYRQVEQSPQAVLRLEMDADLARRVEDLQALDRLAEQADQHMLTRYACLWAQAQGDGEPQAIMGLYQQAVGQLQAAMSELQPLCIDWGVPGAAEWSPEQVSLPQNTVVA